MSYNQEVKTENGGDFAQDVEMKTHNTDGSGDASTQNGHAGKPRFDDRKLFIGGLSAETTEQQLRDHFGQYGGIDSVDVKSDPNTGRSKGFAFLVFASVDSIEKALAISEHVINNKKIDVKKAKAKHGKFFVGGLNTQITDDDIKTHFGQFGNIVEVELPFDKTKNQRKGFCFITFDSIQDVNELLKTPKQTIAGKEVDVKRATPSGNIPTRGGFGGAVRGRGGRGGAWGGANYGGFGGYNQGYGGGYGGYGQGGYGGYGGYDYAAGYSSGGNRNAGGYGGYTSGYQRGGGGRQYRPQPY
uniref:Putative rna-binding protein musashi/mrna cleavage and polyadenylation factor i complex n=1 Tax=Xenopsylla cheopis TaxID=163159 RepID=A0A6M2DIF3_XENCH